MHSLQRSPGSGLAAALFLRPPGGFARHGGRAAPSRGPLRSIALAGLLGLVVCLCGCGSTVVVEPTPAGAVVGRPYLYDYSSSVIQDGTVRKFWWCGQGQNPVVSSQFTDTILYESIDSATGQQVGPKVVLAETPNAWDSAYTCNPHVVLGTFTNPLGDGVTYTYALYYVGTSETEYTNNSIGVAFSNDGISWKKYPSPAIPAHSSSGSGPAQPVAFNVDGKQAITVFYEDDSQPLGPNHHTEAVSSDGVHFTDVGPLTTAGLTIAPSLASWGDMALSSDGFWYATFNLPGRDISSTGGVRELTSPGIELYRIPQDDLLAGEVGWQQLKVVDTNSTGYEAVFLADFLSDGHGNLYDDGSGTVQMFPAFSNLALSWNQGAASSALAAGPNQWDIGQISWSPTGSPFYDLKRYYNGQAHLVTTGWVDPHGGFVLEKTLGKIYQYPQNGATIALNACKTGTTDTFLSLDQGCEGQRVNGIDGYIFAKPVNGGATVPIYRCYTGTDHFVSTDPACEGSRTELLLGFILPE